MTKIDLQRVLDLDTQATDGPWRVLMGDNQADAMVLDGPGHCMADFLHKDEAELIAYYRTAAPAMAKALQEVIALHVETGGKECLTCTDERGPEPYPCPTVQAIHYHLGEQE